MYFLDKSSFVRERANFQGDSAKRATQTRLVKAQFRGKRLRRMSGRALGTGDALWVKRWYFIPSQVVDFGS